VSHTYHGGGGLEQGPTRSVGMLGVDWELANGARGTDSMRLDGYQRLER
jgi:hypothetical protein